jgi:hypothetical protein
MGGGAQASTVRFAQEHEPWSGMPNGVSPRERNGASEKSKASTTKVCLDSAVVVIDGMTTWFQVNSVREFQDKKMRG